jgi:hypothetical protein
MEQLDCVGMSQIRDREERYNDSLRFPITNVGKFEKVSSIQDTGAGSHFF